MNDNGASNCRSAWKNYDVGVLDRYNRWARRPLNDLKKRDRVARYQLLLDDRLLTIVIELNNGALDYRSAGDYNCGSLERSNR